MVRGAFPVGTSRRLQVPPLPTAALQALFHLVLAPLGLSQLPYDRPQTADRQTASTSICLPASPPSASPNSAPLPANSLLLPLSALPRFVKLLSLL